MVGIKGRSKACRTCLRRKKGCGQQRPSCEQCIKARIPCGGYPTELIFIEHTPNSRASKPFTAPNTTEYTPHTSNSHPLSISQERNGKPHTSWYTKSSVGNLGACRTLNQAQEEAKICGMFWDMFLPNSRSLPLDIVREHMGGWINVVQDLHTTEPVLRKAMLALSLTTIGKAQDCSAMLRDGTELYGKALGDLSVALQSSRKTGVNTVLAAIRLFEVYEVLHGMSNKQVPAEMSRASWIAHSAGELALIASQDPSTFAAHHHHQLFVDGRFYLAALALRGRVRTFLNTDAWMTEPWAIHKKTPRDLLVDIFLMTPGLFEDLDASKHYPPDAQLRIRAHLVRTCIDMQDRLQHWHALYSATPHLATCDDEIPETIKAHDLAVAHLMSIYWSTALLCTTLLDSLLSSLQDHPHFHTKITPERRQTFNSDELCRNIVNVVPVCLHPDAGMYRANLIGLQLSVATLHLSIIPVTHMVKERLWLVHNLNKPESESITDFVWSLKCVGAELYSPVDRGPDGSAIPYDVMCQNYNRRGDLRSALSPEVSNLNGSRDDSVSQSWSSLSSG